MGHHREKSQGRQTVRRVALECPRNRINSSSHESLGQIASPNPRVQYPHPWPYRRALNNRGQHIFISSEWKLPVFLYGAVIISCPAIKEPDAALLNTVLLSTVLPITILFDMALLNMILIVTRVVLLSTILFDAVPLGHLVRASFRPRDR